MIFSLYRTQDGRQYRGFVWDGSQKALNWIKRSCPDSRIGRDRVLVCFMDKVLLFVVIGRVVLLGDHGIVVGSAPNQSVEIMGPDPLGEPCWSPFGGMEC